MQQPLPDPFANIGRCVAGLARDAQGSPLGQQLLGAASAFGQWRASTSRMLESAQQEQRRRSDRAAPRVVVMPRHSAAAAPLAMILPGDSVAEQASTAVHQQRPRTFVGVC